MHIEQYRTNEHPGLQSQSNRFRAQATERLFLAVVNQAISDVLENGKEAREAERWLLSEDFDALNRLFAFPAKRVQSLFREERKDGSREFSAPRENGVVGVLPAFGQNL